MEQRARDAAIGDDSIGALLSRVVADAEQAARAEIDLQKARIAAKLEEARAAVVLLLAAVAIAWLALTALVVGALLILTPRLGPVWATVIVVGMLGGGAALCGWLSLRHFKTIFGAAQRTGNAL